MDSEPRPSIRVVSAEIQRDGQYLITQRPSAATLPDLWEFPGGRVRPGETDADALRRAVKTRLGLDLTVGERTLEVFHEYEGYALTLAVYRCAADGQDPAPLKVQSLLWVRPEDFGDYTFPGADQQSVDALLAGDD